MKNRYLILIAFVLTLFRFASHATCPDIKDDEINNFITAVKGAAYTSKIDRYTFKYDGHTWFFEPKHYNFLTQNNFEKRELYDIEEIKSEGESQEKSKLRCKYDLVYTLIYQEDPEKKHRYPFHMTRVIKQ